MSAASVRLLVAAIAALWCADRELAAVPEWTKACGTFDLPVAKATRSHHFAVLRAAGLIEQRDEGSRRLNRLRRPEFDAAFPGLLDLVLSHAGR